MKQYLGTSCIEKVDILYNQGDSGGGLSTLHNSILCQNANQNSFLFATLPLIILFSLMISEGFT